MSTRVVVVCFLILGVSGCGRVCGHCGSAAVVLDGEWRVESIDRGGVIDFSQLTLMFADAGAVTGSTGCNQYQANVDTSGGGFLVSPVVTTRRACPEALMMQEQRMLTALQEASHYRLQSDTWLLIYDAANNERLKLIQTDSDG